jgi:hypothetical protein
MSARKSAGERLAAKLAARKAKPKTPRSLRRDPEQAAVSERYWLAVAPPK